MKKVAQNPKVASIALMGMLLLMLATVSIIVNNNRTPEEIDETVLDSVEVDITEGSAVLKVEYDFTDAEGFNSKGEDDINLKIEKDKEHTDRYIVEGSLSSTQRVDLAGTDQGNICWFNIQHGVDYTVMGTFSPSACKFELSVKMGVNSSTLLSHNCSMDLGLDYSGLYVAPPREGLVFTKSFAGPASSIPEYTIFLYNVALPGSVKCPAFSN